MLAGHISAGLLLLIACTYGSLEAVARSSIFLDSLFIVPVNYFGLNIICFKGDKKTEGKKHACALNDCICFHLLPPSCIF